MKLHVSSIGFETSNGVEMSGLCVSDLKSYGQVLRSLDGGTEWEEVTENIQLKER